MLSALCSRIIFRMISLSLFLTIYIQHTISPSMWNALDYSGTFCNVVDDHDSTHTITSCCVLQQSISRFYEKGIDKVN